MIDDGHRGYLLELIGTKLLSLGQPVQIIGMSATLPVSAPPVGEIRHNTIQNMDLLACWLGGHSYETRYRPVPIEEHLVYDNNIFPTGSNRNLVKTATQLSNKNSSQSVTRPSRRIEPSPHREFADPVMNSVVTLAHETALAGFGVLVFAGSRGICESDARWISRVMPEPYEVPQALVDKRLDLLSDLRSLPTGLDPVLEETVLHGVAFHRKPLPISRVRIITDY